MGGQYKCVSYVFEKSPASFSVGDKLAQAAADYENGTSLSNSSRLSGTKNGAGASTSFSGRNDAVSGCAFTQGPTDADLQEVKCEEERENDGALIWKLGNYRRRKIE